MKVRCPDCGSRGTLSAELAGQMVRCSRCGGKFTAQEDQGETGKKWYYALEHEKKGPISETEFDRLVAAGEIVAATLVWSKGMTGWQPLAEVQGAQATVLAREEPSQEQELPTEAQPQADLPPAPGGRSAAWPGLAYAGGGKRLVAKFIDLVFMFALASLVEGLSRKLFPDSFPDGGEINEVYLVTMFLCFLLGMGYLTWFIGKYGATPGKMVMNLKVVTPTGGRVGYGHAFKRYWAESVVVFLTLFLGYLPVPFDAQRRGLHDRLCGTRVVVM